MAGSRVIGRAIAGVAVLGAACAALYLWLADGRLPAALSGLLNREVAPVAGAAAVPVAPPVVPPAASPSPGSLLAAPSPESVLAAPSPQSVLAAPSLESMLAAPGWLDPARMGSLVLIVGLLLCLIATALAHVLLRARYMRRLSRMQAEVARARMISDRAESFLATEPQVLLTWTDPLGDPLIEGDVTIVAVDAQPRRVLAFGSYLKPADAQAIEMALERLKVRGEAFSQSAQTVTGRFLAADGRVISGKAVLRLREATGDRAELARTEELLGGAEAELGALRVMLDEIPQPVWVRDRAGRIAWTNAAYARAVEAPDVASVVGNGTELIDQAARDEAARRREQGLAYLAQVPGVIAGDRRMLDVVEVPGNAGSAGIATDVSELASLRDDLGRQMEAHSRTLDQLPTGVAIFDASQHLVFHNSAYRLLWSLDQSFLDSSPSDGDILERLRAERRLPEEADFRLWKASVLACYFAVEPRDHWWYLPDGRTLRVVTNPNPQGGVTYLFDDVSERFQLESRYNGLIGVQGETLDTLREGVAVFGPDGRLRLANPAFERLWRLPKDMVASEPHVDEILDRARRVVADEEHWSDVRAAVVGLHDSRRAVTCRLQPPAGGAESDLIIDCAVAPLPDGSTLLTFTDVTASARMERVLTERNEALQKASMLREEFVHHVSYELRSPLTNIIGYVELLGSDISGTLIGKQREYIDHILRSSTALTAIIDDILDLATIDNGTLTLDREPIDIRQTIEAAARGVEDRLAEASIALAIDVPDDIGRFEADRKRVRQVLFNLLSNAISFSQPRQGISLRVRRDRGAIVFDVIDNGRGIPAEIVDKVFERFESHSPDARSRRGLGLGLAMVRSFVELHGGHVEIHTVLGQGTRVTCVFPTADVAVSTAAE